MLLAQNDLYPVSLDYSYWCDDHVTNITAISCNSASISTQQQLQLSVSVLDSSRLPVSRTWTANRVTSLTGRKQARIIRLRFVRRPPSSPSHRTFSISNPMRHWTLMVPADQRERSQQSEFWDKLRPEQKPNTDAKHTTSIPGVRFSKVEPLADSLYSHVDNNKKISIYLTTW